MSENNLSPSEIDGLEEMRHPTPREPMLSEAAYDAIKWRVLNLDIPTGKLFSIAELCELVGMGRAPVSHAVLRLQEERLIEVIPRKGIMVKAFSPEMFANIVAVRAPLEITSVRLAAEKATHSDVAQLKEIVAREELHVENADPRELRKCDTELHLAIAKISGNEILVEEVGYLHQISSSAWYSHVSGRDSFERSHAQHVAIVAAIGANDPDGAEQAMRFHLNSVGARRKQSDK